MKIVIAGGTGFLGKKLVESFKGHDVTVLVRKGDAPAGAKAVIWDGMKTGLWTDSLEGADVLINYSGAPVTLKWTDENKKKIRESRVHSTYVLGQAIDGCENPPKVWINGSAVGFYGDRGAELLDETSSAGTGFLPETCVAWEEALYAETLPKTRRVALRTGLVLGKGGGLLKPYLTLTKLFLGGQAADGHQWMPWIHIDDHIGMVHWLIENDIQGPVNACCPNPVSNASFMATLRKVVGRPPALPTPKFVFEIVGKLTGPDPEAALMSSRTLPKVAKDAGFVWKFSNLELALRDLLGKPIR